MKLVYSEPIVVAVVKFTGELTEPLIAEKKAALLAAMKESGLNVEHVMTGKLLVGGYDPPWTPPTLSMSEVWLELREDALSL